MRASKGKEDRSRRGERYGYASWERPVGPLVWLHAASVGESLAIMPLIERMESFGINLVLTTGTVTSAGIAEERLSARTIHQYVPLDMKRAVGRFLDHWKPDMAIFAESEIWPTTIQQLALRNIPQLLINARMSDRSNRRWLRRKNLAHAIFSQISHVIAQTETDSERFSALGVPRVSVAGNLKNDVAAPEADPATLKAFASMVGDRPAWTAVSTHKGEEAMVGTVHRMLMAHMPGILTVLVPRHPARADEIEKELQAQGLRVVRRSKNETIKPDTDIFLGDTIGEMGTYLRLSKIAFMGKSVKSQGGQNPIEPALVGSAILSGRFVQNFRQVYQALIDGGGARLVEDEKMLARQVFHLLRDSDDLNAMTEAAAKTVASMGGALERSIAVLDPYIMPLRVKAGLERRGLATTTKPYVLSAGPAEHEPAPGSSKGS